MPVYVDDAAIPWGTRGQWYHLACAAGDDLETLHAFAAALGLKRAWFQDQARHPHYDISGRKRVQAIRMGAVPVGRRDFIRFTTRDLPAPAGGPDA